MSGMGRFVLVSEHSGWGLGSATNHKLSVKERDKWCWIPGLFQIDT